MSNMEAYYIPRRLDDPDRFFIWTVDELGIICTPFILGIAWGYFATGFAVGIGLYLLWKKVKGIDGINFANALIYWYLPSQRLLGFRLTPPSYIRFFVG